MKNKPWKGVQGRGKKNFSGVKLNNYQAAPEAALWVPSKAWVKKKKTSVPGRKPLQKQLHPAASGTSNPAAEPSNHN